MKVRVQLEEEVKLAEVTDKEMGDFIKGSICHLWTESAVLPC